MVGTGSEFVGLAAGTLLTGFLKYSANKQAFTQRMEEMRQLAEDKRIEAFQKARDAEVSGWTRFGRAFVIVGLISAYVFQMVGPAFFDVTMHFYYFETNQGFWPWSVPFDQMKSVMVGSGNHPIIITPYFNNALMTILGFLFGHSTQQR